VLPLPRHPSLGPAGRKLIAQIQELLPQLRKKKYPAVDAQRKQQRKRC